jgi:ankyrin repeat protein
MDSSRNIDKLLNAREATTYDKLLKNECISDVTVCDDYDGRSALHYIPEIGYTKGVDPAILCCYILTCYNPGEVNARDIDGWTPMIHAALWSSPGALKVLMDFGGDRNLKNNSNESTLEYAKRDNNQEIVTMLTERFPSEMQVYIIVMMKINSNILLYSINNSSRST